MKLLHDPKTLSKEEKMSNALLYITWSNILVDKANDLLLKAKKSGKYNKVTFDSIENNTNSAKEYLSGYSRLIMGTISNKAIKHEKDKFIQNAKDLINNTINTSQSLMSWSWAFLCESLIALHLAIFTINEISTDLSKPLNNLEAASKEIFGIDGAAIDAMNLITLDDLTSNIM